MSYNTIRFGDLYLIESRNGLSKPSKIRGTGFKMINMGELFANDRIYDIPMELVPLKDSEKITAKVEVGDLLFARQSLVLEGAGKCSIVMETSPLTVFESHLIRVRLVKEANPMFYYYYFRSPLSPIKTIVSQCAQAGIRGSDLQELTVLYPPKVQQDRIADILSTYDNLIENNQRQIKLLEEAAQRLYKEWFVDLRFPGYEDVEFVDGVPKGWKVLTINSVANIKAGGDKPKEFSETITAEYSIPVFANGISEKGLMGYTSKPAINEPSVTISARGTVGVVFLRREPYMPIVRLISVTPKKEVMDVLYLYLHLKTQNFRATGAAQQQITVPLLKNTTIVCPVDDIRKKFNDLVIPFFDKLYVLENQNIKLKEARDRLLPRLMNGEIEV
jgi:type I restriction enzyme S subunit